MEENKNKNGSKINLTWIYVIIAAVLGYLVLASDNATGVMGGSSKTVAYGEFKTYVENGYAQRIIANSTHQVGRHSALRHGMGEIGGGTAQLLTLGEHIPQHLADADNVHLI